MDGRNFQLPNAGRRMQLIEILLIVGSIMAAFNKSPIIIALFMLFVLFSILYYIFVQKEKENFSYIGITSTIVSSSFVVIIIYNLIDSLYRAYLKGYLGFLKVSPTVYLVLIVVIVFVYLPFLCSSFLMR